MFYTNTKSSSNISNIEQFVYMNLIDLPTTLKYDSAYVQTPSNFIRINKII